MSARSAGLVGGVCGLAWGSAIRGWMAEIAGLAHSQVTWLTALLVLVPGTLLGVAFGRAAYLRTHGGRPGRLTVFAPVLLAAAILDPKIFHQLVTTGMGGGSLLVVLTMLAGGHALGAVRWTVWRVATALVAALGIAAMLGVGGIAGPPVSPRGLWVAVYGAAILAVGCVAAAIPYPPRRPAAPDARTALQRTAGSVTAR